ncbi:hypothetical protein Glove_22g168 [Diversispora epigaea]|uniref:Uncharacterized protein n=1 Tax=Diversispora epigaea TaxID=1348612 RepID=A0A397JTC5_9GLOM|nr:hypothetical protein Glove_22g168 [Diversispora epigaea]
MKTQKFVRPNYQNDKFSFYLNISSLSSSSSSSPSSSLQKIKNGLNIKTSFTKFDCGKVMKLKKEESDNNNSSYLFLVNAHSSSFSSSSLSFSSSNNNNNNNNIGNNDTIILQFIQKFPDKPCAESRAIMRYFETNDGRTIIIENDIQFNFSQVNFCPTSKIEIYPLTKKRFNLVIYLEETSDSTSDSWVQFSAMVVGWDGIVYKSDFSPLSVPFLTRELELMTTRIVSNDNNFLWTLRFNNSNSINWVRFNSLSVLNTTLDFNSPPNISINGTGTFLLPNNNNNNNNSSGVDQVTLLNYTTFSTIDNNFGITLSALSLNTTTPAAFVAFLIKDNNEFNYPFPIYQTTTPLSLLEINDCGIDSFEGSGFKCILTGKELISSNDTNNNNTDNNNNNTNTNVGNRNNVFHVTVKFLITGLVFKVDELQPNITSITISNNNNNSSDNSSSSNSSRVSVIDIKFNPLYYGGFLLRIFTNIGIIGQIFDSKDNFNSEWDIPIKFTITNLTTDAISNTTENSNSVRFGIFINNTAFLVQSNENNENGSVWSVISTDLPKVFDDEGFISPNIFTSSLPNNVQVSLGTTSFTITFLNPIIISVGNITIYQINSNNNNSNNNNLGDILRQSFSANSEFVSLGINNLELRITVLESTFNQPSSIYYITFDDNFVRSKLTNNAIAGVPPRFWILNTPESNDTFTDITTITGFIRFSESGTSLFTNLSKSDQTLFVDQLISQISMTLPISLTRIFGSTKFQFETKVTTNKLLLPITISSTSTIENITSERSVINVAKNLDTLIRNKRITALSFLDKLKDVDDEFGFRWEVKDKINYKLATVGIALSILAIAIILFFMTRKDSDEGRNWIILKLFIILVDFVFDLLFVIYHGRDVQWLHGPSILFVSLPLSLCITTSLLILIHEINENQFFYNYFQNHNILSIMITLFSFIDLSFFELLDSKIFGQNKLFGVVYSEPVEYCLFWKSVGLFFVRDLGQWIIQAKYNVIPFFTLVFSTLIIASHLIEWIYVTFFKKDKKENFEITEEDF